MRQQMTAWVSQRAGRLCALALTLGIATGVAGQVKSTADVAPRALIISILEGEGELNDVRARTAREPIVQIEDENHKPVAGALVLFTIQGSSQPAATFSGLSTLTVRTGADGRAVGRGFRVTRSTGSFQIKVAATLAAVQAETFIHQTNFSKGGRLSRLKNYSADHPTLTSTTVGVAAFATAASIIAFSSQAGATQITAGTGVVGR